METGECNCIVMDYEFSFEGSCKWNCLLFGCLQSLSRLKEHFDKVDATKIYHVRRQITTLTQGTFAISTYFLRLSEFWEEYESLFSVWSNKNLCNFWED